MASSFFNSNILYYGDNLDILHKHFPPECIDLIYLDPPFNSKADYNVLFKEKTGKESVAQAQAFSDSWTWDTSAESTYMELQKDPRIMSMIQFLHAHLGKNDMMAYLVMMTIRLRELKRVLKPTGSIYLHCDPTASHYLKIIMDLLFEKQNFMGEIVWRRTASHVTSRRWPRLHDILLNYAKDHMQVKFHPPRIERDKEWVKREYRLTDERGQYMIDNLTGAGTTEGPSGKPWRGVDPAKIGSGRHWRYSPETLDKLDTEGRIYWPKHGQYPKLKQYLDEGKGAAVGDLWTDKEVQVLGRTASERLGYPTQKPQALLERIIRASSDEGDVVLDPFCGCGTTIMAAHKLKRKWIGMDITHLAISLIRSRLRKIHVYAEKDYKIIGEPVDLASASKLAKDDKYQFQYWAVSLIDAFPVGQTSESPYGKKGADKGVDGWLTFKEGDNLDLKRIVIQIKGGENIGAQQVRDLVGTVESRKASMGILITLIEPTKPMKIAAMEAGYYESPTWGHQYPKIQIITISELFEGQKPNIPHTHD